MDHYTLLLDSPLGPLTLRSDGECVTALRFGIHQETSPLPCPVLARAVRELAEYFAGERRRFTVPLAPGGTVFQRQVWDALAAIPYGEARTYAQIAAAVGAPGPAAPWAWPTTATPCPFSSPVTGWWAATAVSPGTPADWTGSYFCCAWRARDTDAAPLRHHTFICTRRYY